MSQATRAFFGREEGQDLADYCLITALVALVAGAILISLSGGLGNLWTVANRTIQSGNSAVSSGPAGGGSGGSPSGRQ